MKTIADRSMVEDLLTTFYKNSLASRAYFFSEIREARDPLSAAVLRANLIVDRKNHAVKGPGEGGVWKHKFRFKILSNLCIFLKFEIVKGIKIKS